MIDHDKKFHENIFCSTSNVFGASISSEMRKTLVKWLAKVAARFRVKSDTLHMCIQMIDLMMMYQGTFFNRANFQLLGVTALFISCKYHEIYTIEADKYVQLCDGIYSASQLF